MNSPFTTDQIAALRCDKCGSDILPPSNEAPDETLIYCLKCGTKGERWGDIKAVIYGAMTNESKEVSRDVFGKPFDGSAGMTFKKSK